MNLAIVVRELTRRAVGQREREHVPSDAVTALIGDLARVRRPARILVIGRLGKTRERAHLVTLGRERDQFNLTA